MDLEDEAFWFLYSWAAREHRKAHEQASLLLARDIETEQQRQQGDEPAPAGTAA